MQHVVPQEVGSKNKNCFQELRYQLVRIVNNDVGWPLTETCVVAPGWIEVQSSIGIGIFVAL